MKVTPNQITFIRILLIPILIFFYLASFIPFGKLISLILFIIACLTDFLDGYLARKNNMVSVLGTFLDTIADKMLVISALVLLVSDATILAPYGAVSLILIIARELIVSALRQLAASKNVIIAADMWGKVKANFQFFCIMSFMLLSFLVSISLSGWFVTFILVLSYVLLVVTVVATLISGYHYIIKNKEVFK